MRMFKCAMALGAMMSASGVHASSEPTKSNQSNDKERQVIVEAMNQLDSCQTQVAVAILDYNDFVDMRGCLNVCRCTGSAIYNIALSEKRAKFVKPVNQQDSVLPVASSSSSESTASNSIKLDESTQV